ncbi:hypothetical protein [Psychrobacillus sp. FJAT-21963]|uniref:hypothetical protein n=1 Tax=Psychrobacillus sp. FJAT-21963 TaxID=1712028 RepID=UPI0006FE2F06|nr:hypothetical protein [Psychrobacillus sp. FJAT-21963]KQL33720.1 hypothetical protein AN959_16485 [Psychrobacillus sp. FJAT-21963]
MRLSNQEMLDKLGTAYIDEELKVLSYDNKNGLVQMSYGDSGEERTILFESCLSVSFNKWHTGNISFFFHEITIEDIEIDGQQFYKCNLVIPMMDCQITCQSIEIS